MAKEKQEFKWDSESLLKTIEVSEYERREIRICELKGKQYVSFTTVKKIKEVWKPVGGYTVPKSMWCDVVAAVSDHDITALSGIAVEKAAEPIAPSKPTKTKSEKAKANKEALEQMIEDTKEPKTDTKKSSRAKKSSTKKGADK
jgi:ribosomal protein L12E/L44/L45/RPP1/RPP2